MNQRLEIPKDVDPQWASIIESCWHRCLFSSLSCFPHCSAHEQLYQSNYNDFTLPVDIYICASSNQLVGVLHGQTYLQCYCLRYILIKQHKEIEKEKEHNNPRHIQFLKSMMSDQSIEVSDLATHATPCPSSSPNRRRKDEGEKINITMQKLRPY